MKKMIRVIYAGILYAILNPAFSYSQCKLDYTGYELVFFDDFKRYETVEQLFTNNSANDYQAKWWAKMPWGNTYGTFDTYCNNVAVKTRQIILTDNISLIDDPDEPGDKCITLGFNVHKDGISNPADPGDKETYYKSGAGITARYEEPAIWDDCDVMEGFRYGIFEVRCKIPMTIGYQTAFWFWSGMWDGECGRTDSGCDSTLVIQDNNRLSQGSAWEVDIFEAMNKGYAQYDANEPYDYSVCNNSISDYGYNYYQWMVSAIQPNNSSTFPHNSCNVCLNSYELRRTRFSDEFHTYTFVWLPEKMSIFLDGKEIRTDYNSDQRGVPNKEMYLILNNYLQWLPTFDIRSGTPETAPFTNNSMYDINRFFCGEGASVDYEVPDDPLIIDYVRVYKPILQTQEIIFPEYKTATYYDSVVTNIGSVYESEQNIITHPDGANERIYYVENFSPPRNRLAYYIRNGGTFSYHIANNTPFLSKETNLAKDNDGNIYFIGTERDVWRYDPIKDSSFALDPMNIYSNDAISDLAYHNIAQRVYFRGYTNELCFYEKTGSSWNMINTGIYNVHSSLVTYEDVNKRVYYRTTDDKVANYLLYGGIEDSYILDYNYVYNDAITTNISISPGGEKIFFGNAEGEMTYYKWDGSYWILHRTDIKNVAKNVLSRSDTEVFFTSDKSGKHLLEQSLFNTRGGHWMSSSFNHFSYADNLNQYAFGNNVIIMADDNKYLNYIAMNACEITNPHCLTNGESRHCLEDIKINFRQITETTKHETPPAVLYPNPFDHILTWNQTEDQFQELTIVNNIGQVIFYTKDFSTRNIYTEQWPAGIYFYRINRGTDAQTGKIIKN